MATIGTRPIATSVPTPGEHARSQPGSEAVIDEVFLTPRVLDEGAFVRYAESLKELIRDSGGRAQTLRELKDDGARMTTQAGKAGEELKKRLELGARLLGAIEERARAVEGTIERVERAGQSTSAIETRLGELIEAKVTEAEQRLGAVLAARERSIEEVAKQVEARAHAVEAKVREAERAASERAGKLALISTDLDARINAVAERTGAIVARAERASGELEGAVAAAARRARDQIMEIERTVAPIRAACERACGVLGIDMQTGEATPTGLRELLGRGEELAERASFASRQLDDLRRLAEEARVAFGRSITEAAEKMDALESRRDALDGEVLAKYERLAEQAPTLTGAMHAMTSDLDLLRRSQAELRALIEQSLSDSRAARDELQNRADHLKALVDGSALRLKTEAEQAGRWLGSIVRRAEELSGQMGTQMGTQTGAQIGMPAGGQTISTPAPKPAAAPPRDTAESRTAALLAELKPTHGAGELSGVPAPHAPRPSPLSSHLSSPVRPAKPARGLDDLSFDGAGTVIPSRPIGGDGAD